MNQVTERAVVRRINRRLPEFERVHFSRTGPRYRHIDAYHNALLAEFDDLEAFARDCGALADDEAVA